MLSESELVALHKEVEAAAGRLYAEIASMDFETRVRAGVQVYYVDWVAPYARAAGLWENEVEEQVPTEWRDDMFTELKGS